MNLQDETNKEGELGTGCFQTLTTTSRSIVFTTEAKMETTPYCELTEEQKKILEDLHEGDYLDARDSTPRWAIGTFDRSQ
jgi:hypothetical protein